MYYRVFSAALLILITLAGLAGAVAAALSPYDNDRLAGTLLVLAMLLALGKTISSFLAAWVMPRVNSRRLREMEWHQELDRRARFDGAVEQKLASHGIKRRAIEDYTYRGFLDTNHVKVVSWGGFYEEQPDEPSRRVVPVERPKPYDSDRPSFSPRT